MSYTKLAMTVAALVQFSCVGKSKYDSLAAELSATRADLSAQLENQINATKTLEQALAEEKARGEAVEKERNALSQQLAGVIKDRSRLKGSVEDMARAMDELQRRKAESDARVAEFRGLLDRFKTMIDAGKLKVKIVDGRMVVELATDVLFASGSAKLSVEGTAALQEVAKILAEIPGRIYQVEGHTDNDPIGGALTRTFPTNWELASARSITVVKTMIETGLPAQRISGASFSEFRPAVTNETPEGKAANRRIEIVLVPNLASLPGFEELKNVAGGR